jgi:hypothetical protein
LLAAWPVCRITRTWSSPIRFSAALAPCSRTTIRDQDSLWGKNVRGIKLMQTDERKFLAGYEQLFKVFWVIEKSK